MSEAATLKEEGNAKFKAGQYPAAVEAYTRSLELDPKQHLVLSNRSAAYLKLGNSAEEALRDAERCVELAPDFAKGYSRQAAAYQDLRRWDEAASACERGLAETGDEGLRKMLAEVRNRRFQDQIIGAWHGTVSEELGGYEQEMEFLEAGRVRVEVLGRGIVGTYWVDCSQEPSHLNIQVPMPDAPPGMPPPPPVPYIVRLDEAGLHLCCPYMVMERPRSFDGPGYCVMVRGKPASVDDGLSSLTVDDKLLLCASEVTAALPNTRLEEPKQTDTEEVTRDKLMMQVRFESSMFAVQKKFGEDLMKQVLSAAKGDGPLPPVLSGSAELKELRAKLNTCGLLEEDDIAGSGGPAPSTAPPPAVAPPMPPPPAPRPEQAAAAAGAAGGEDQEGSSPAAGDTTLLVAAGGLVLAAAAVLAAAVFWQRRRRVSDS